MWSFHYFHNLQTNKCHRYCFDVYAHLDCFLTIRNLVPMTFLMGLSIRVTVQSFRTEHLYCLTVQLLLILSPLNLIISVLYNPGDEFPIVISQNTLTTLYSSLQLYYCSLITNVLPTITSFAEVLLSDFVSAVCLFFLPFAMRRC